MNILLILLLPIGGIIAIIAAFTHLLSTRKKQHEQEVLGLTKALEGMKAELGKTGQALKERGESAQYDTYAKLVISQMNQGVICIDQSRLVRLVNTYAEQFIDGGSPVGQPYQQVLHLQTPNGPGDFAIIEAAFSGKTQVLPDNYAIVCRRGTFPISGTVTALRTDHTVGTVVFVFADNTQQVARIKEEQAFFSAAAHELRTPLSIIRLTVSLLREQFDTLGREKIIENLARTDETTVRLVKLVNDFLNISRIDQGRLEMKTELFDIVKLTDEVIEDHKLLASERKLYVHHEPTGTELRTVIGDRSKAKEVLSNLVSNAIKYTIQGGLTITHSTNDSVLATKVTDTGAGIPLEYQRLLFKRFQQIGQAKEQASTKSSGLGLYISKKLAQLMRGDVVLEKSEPGTGSTFTFTLPLGR